MVHEYQAGLTLDLLHAMLCELKMGAPQIRERGDTDHALQKEIGMHRLAVLRFRKRHYPVIGFFSGADLHKVTSC